MNNEEEIDIVEIQDLFIEQICSEIKKLQDLAKSVINNNASNYKSHVRYIDGQIHGLETAKNELVSLITNYLTEKSE